jgi:hypothetical protein
MRKVDQQRSSSSAAQQIGILKVWRRNQSHVVAPVSEPVTAMRSDELMLTT